MPESDQGNAAPSTAVNEGSVSAEQFIAARRAKQAPKPAMANQEAQPPTEPEAAAPEGSEGTEQQPAAQDNVLSDVLAKLEGIDLSTVPDADRAKLAALLKSKAVDRFGELTRKAKSLEEQLAQLKAEKEKEQPLQPSQKDNPFADIAKVEDLQAKFDEVNAHIEWAENLLDGAEGLHLDDVIEFNGQQYQKRAIKDSLKAARKAKEVFLPAQYKSVIEREERKIQRQLVEERTQKELSASLAVPEIKQAYEEIRKGIDFDAIERVAPDFAVQLPEILGYYVSGKYRPKTAPTKAPLKPPASPAGVAGAAPSGANKQDGMIKELSARFAQTQSASDFIALQNAKRRLQAV